MSKMGTLVRVGVVGGLGVLGLGGGFYAWANAAANSYMSLTYEAHHQGFPIPFPLTEAELAQLRVEHAPPVDPAAPPVDPAAPAVDPLAGLDLDAIARERAVARGDHLVHSLFVCVECHGADFGGGTMIDDPAVGKVLGPNLTLGKGGVTAAYTAEDWDRKVRHGVGPGGRGGPMPSEDYLNMSDRELSDIVSYIRSLPPVDKEVPPPSLGPVGVVLAATGQLRTAADIIETQRTDHPVLPPETGVTLEYGKHLLNVCVGCHRTNFEGGAIRGAPPDWLPAGNISNGPEGIGAYSEADFVRVIREAKKPDGSPVGLPMTLITKYAGEMTDTELSAMWLALREVPAVPDGK